MSIYFACHRVNCSGHPLNERLRAAVGVMYPGYYELPVTTQQIPLAAHGWGTKYLLLDMDPPLLAEEEEPPT
jgi:hypothetical protein